LKRSLFVFRHGETDWNAEQRFQGHLDVPMNDRGREQARELVPALRTAGIQAILASDLSRACETAEIVARELGVPVQEAPGLREAFLGKAQGLTRAEIEERFGQEIASRWRSWHVTDADVCYPDGESGKQVMTRVRATIERYLAGPGREFERVGIATHGGVIRRLMQSVLPEGSEPVPIPNGVLYEVCFEPEGRRWGFVRSIEYLPQPRKCGF
jgi:broad specificity phosphatase PhoE